MANIIPRSLLHRCRALPFVPARCDASFVERRRATSIRARRACRMEFLEQRQMLCGDPVDIVEPPLVYQGTTNTGLDRLVEIVVNDPGLNRNLTNAEILTAAESANRMNELIVEAILATGVATDGTLNAADVRELNGYLRQHYNSDDSASPDAKLWVALHGDDADDGTETGFHLVQNDGATTKIFGCENAVDTVADGVYHLGFAICGDQVLNEDGNPNASVCSIAFWLTEFLQKDLEAWETLDDAYVAPKTGTGLDALVEIVVSDPGLNRKVSTGEIYAGAEAAYAMNVIILDAIKGTGVANDGAISAADVRALNGYIRANVGETAWAALHGDDADDGTETGFHLVQNDGATTQLFTRNAVNTVADGIYHLGFAIVCDQLLNEDGAKNAGVASVAFWLGDLLRDDLAAGTLQNAALMPDAAAIASALAFSTAPAQPFTGRNYLDLAHQSSMAQANGTMVVRFTADNVVGAHALLSKDASGYGAGGHITVLVRDGRVEVRMQSKTAAVSLASQGGTVLAGKEYEVAVGFGAAGLRLYLDGELVASKTSFTTGLTANTEKLVLGANAASRSAKNAKWATDYFVGTIKSVAIYSRALSQPEVALLSQTGRSPVATRGTTGTGLDAIVDLVLSDPGLNRRIPLSEVAAGAGYADRMNALIVEAIVATGVATDGTINEADVRELNRYLRQHYNNDDSASPDAKLWVALHGDDADDGTETGFHLVQNDGATTRLFGCENAVDTVADGIYHLGFAICGDRVLNEDGNPNASVSSLAFWLTEFLQQDLEAWEKLDDAYVAPQTGTGLDKLVEIVVSDPGLNRKVSTGDIYAGAEAAHAMNVVIVDAIKNTGVANDGTFTAGDVRELNYYIRQHTGETAWAALHGDDADDGTETGFHLVQNDGATTKIFNCENAVNTVADGIYHLGFALCGSRLLNEDGNANASVVSVAFWLNELLEKDLAAGTLKTPEGQPNPLALAGTTGTGLDKLVDVILSDPGLNRYVRTGEIVAGANAAYEMNRILLAAIDATGVLADGQLSTDDVRALNARIRLDAAGVDRWAALHGDDEPDSETGFHLVQNDGATTDLFGRNAVNTVADGIYHLGFAIRCGQLLNEDGAKNASLGSVAEWLNDLLHDDIIAGRFHA